MAAKVIRVPFEKRELALNIPEGWRVISELTPKPLPRIEDLPSALIEGLENPIGRAGLASSGLAGKRIAVIVDDVSRPTPIHLFFHTIFEYLYAHGVRKEDIFIITALGVHRNMTQEEIEKKLGKGNIKGIRWINHDCRDIDGHINLGTTKRGTEVLLNRHLKDADLILCVGLIEPHPLLGFGGGLKIILPGLAHEKTIAQNHMQGVSSERFNYIGMSESPMRLDLEEAALMLEKEIFIINAIMNRNLEIARFVCGDPISAHREGIKTSKFINAINILEPADIAIVASNPMNTDLRQGIKCIANTEMSVKEGGLIMALLECTEGMGDITVPSKTLPLSYELIRLLLKAAGRKKVLWLAGKINKKAGIEERFLLHFSMQIARKNRIFIYSNNLPRGIEKRMKLFRLFSDINEMIKVSRGLVPKSAALYVYPYGGVTYPVLKT